jgi:trans-aconitate 2-methyltransferase
MGSVLSAAEYQQLLAAHCRHLELWETTYWQVLQGDDAVFEWMKGTTMVPYLARLDAVATDDFLVGLSRAFARCISAPFGRLHALPFSADFSCGAVLSDDGRC